MDEKNDIKKKESELTPEEREEDKVIEQLQNKVSECEDKYRRALADYQNLQRRTQEQKAEWIKSANKDLLLKLLPVLDTLMLAAKHIDDKGLHISVDHFITILEQEGLTRIKTIGEKFDPYTMEAITTREGEEGKVIEEVRAGFMLYETVLRTAQVIVGKA